MMQQQPQQHHPHRDADADLDPAVAATAAVSGSDAAAQCPPRRTSLAAAEEEAGAKEAAEEANTAPPSAPHWPLPAFNWNGPTPEDTSNDDTDSAISTSSRSVRTSSVTSSVYDYRYENGRRYHARRDGHDYDLPNDDLESDRLDLQHHLYLLTLGGALHRAPLRRDVQKVLDIGTGTGIWAVDFADQYESAEVVGVDISPIQPIYVPPNCQFYIEDIESQWTFSPDTFDYVHARMLVVAIRNWPRLLSQAFDALKPGAWFELQDLCMPLRCDDGSAAPDSPFMRWCPLVMEGARNLGCCVDILNYLEQLMKDAGFVDIHAEWYHWAINKWPKDKKQKEIGMWMLQNLEDGIQGLSMGFLTRGLGWTKDEVDVFVAQIRTQMRDSHNHMYLPIGVFYGRKPHLPPSAGS